MSTPLLRIGNVTIDRERHIVKRAGVEVSLTRRPFELLVRLVEADGRVLSNAMLVDHGHLSDVSSNAVAVHVAQIRALLGKDVIRTRYGVGYYVRPS